MKHILQGPRLRVLINGIHAKAGGGITYLANLIPELAREPDLELHLLIDESQNDSFAVLNDVARVHLVKVPSAMPRMLLWEQVQVPLIAHMIAADVVISAANYGPLLARNHVIVLHNSLAVGTRERRLQKKIYWWGLKVATFVSLLVARRSLGVSNYAASTLFPHALSGFLARPAVVPHGISNLFSPDPQGAEREDFLLAVADFYIQKNIHTLLTAMRLLVEQRPHLVLQIAGAEVDRDYAMRIRQQVVDLRLEKNVRFLGRLSQPQLVELYRRCALFVFPSSEETFGMPLVEAMACGAPVVCANVAAMPEVVGGAALMVDPANPDDIAAQIAKVLDDPALRADLAARSLQRALRFSWAKTADATACILREAAGRQNVKPRP